MAPLRTYVLALTARPLIRARMVSEGTLLDGQLPITVVLSLHSRLTNVTQVTVPSRQGIVLIGSFVAGTLQTRVAVKYPKPAAFGVLPSGVSTNATILEEAARQLVCAQKLRIASILPVQALFWDQARSAVGFSMAAVPPHILLNNFQWGKHDDSVNRLILIVVLDTLIQLHQCGIAYGDLHPENVLVSHVHGVYMIDLGLAKTFDDVDSDKARRAFAKDAKAWSEMFQSGFPGMESTLPCIAVVQSWVAAASRHPETSALSLQDIWDLWDMCACVSCAAEDVENATSAGILNAACDVCAGTESSSQLDLWTTTATGSSDPLTDDSVLGS